MSRAAMLLAALDDMTEPNQLESVLLTLLNVPLTVVPRLVTIVIQATRINASMTAYSTAVGPSSETTN
jgi:hypothetical protein